MAQFAERLGQTLLWLELERPLRLVDGLVVRRSRLVHDEECVDDLPGAFTRWRAERDALLPPGRGTASFAKGRVLLLLTDFNLMDGSAWTASGLFDEYNVPWCDLWIDLLQVNYVHVIARDGRTPALAAWIPRELEPQAQAAIDVNPEQCLGWADQLLPDWTRFTG